MTTECRQPHAATLLERDDSATFITMVRVSKTLTFAQQWAGRRQSHRLVYVVFVFEARDYSAAA